jgi:hypothetical protein
MLESLDRIDGTPSAISVTREYWFPAAKGGPRSTPITSAASGPGGQTEPHAAATALSPDRQGTQHLPPGSACPEQGGQDALQDQFAGRTQHADGAEARVLTVAGLAQAGSFPRPCACSSSAAAVCRTRSARSSATAVCA